MPPHAPRYAVPRRHPPRLWIPQPDRDSPSCWSRVQAAPQEGFAAEVGASAVAEPQGRTASAGTGGGDKPHGSVDDTWRVHRLPLSPRAAGARGGKRGSRIRQRTVARTQQCIAPSGCVGCRSPTSSLSKGSMRKLRRQSTVKAAKLSSSMYVSWHAQPPAFDATAPLSQPGGLVRDRVPKVLSFVVWLPLQEFVEGSQGRWHREGWRRGRPAQAGLSAPLLPVKALSGLRAASPRPAPPTRRERHAAPPAPIQWSERRPDCTALL